MTPDAQRILASLRQVAERRASGAADPQQQMRIAAIKTYQQRRFRLDYAALLDDRRYGPAARFFLDELYGPADYSQRDAQVERIVPALVRLFPKEMVHTVSLLVDLHALSEALDGDMAQHLDTLPPGPASYVRAWQATGRPRDRELQIRLMLQVGEALDRYTGNPLLRNSLKLMRGPARGAGLSSLQGFLEKGFGAFRAMRGATEFLATIARNERTLADELFAASPGHGAASSAAWQERLPDESGGSSPGARSDNE